VNGGGIGHGGQARGIFAVLRFGVLHAKWKLTEPESAFFPHHQALLGFLSEIVRVILGDGHHHVRLESTSSRREIEGRVEADQTVLDAV
jgi:hypothetical protein